MHHGRGSGAGINAILPFRGPCFLFANTLSAGHSSRKIARGYFGLYSLKNTLTFPSSRSSEAVLGRRASRTLYAKYEATARISVTTIETKITVARMLTQSKRMVLVPFSCGDLNAALASQLSPRHIEANELLESRE